MCRPRRHARASVHAGGLGQGLGVRVERGGRRRRQVAGVRDATRPGRAQEAHGVLLRAPGGKSGGARFSSNQIVKCGVSKMMMQRV